MLHQRTTPLLTPVVWLALLAITAVASVRAVAGPAPSAAAPPIESAAASAAPIDRGARQIVESHPIIPLPSAVGPALVGVAFVARRVLRSNVRAAARYR